MGSNSQSRPFRWEHQLRESFEAHSHPSMWCRLPKVTLQLTFRESSCSDGRADFVWAGISEDRPVRCRAKIAVLLRQPTCSRILAALKPRAVRSEKLLLERSGVIAGTFRRWMRRLIAADLISETAPGSYTLGTAFPAADIEFCAFEFKLDDWKRALYQATRYRSFSHRVFVVMPTDMMDNLVRNAERFRRLNIGLIAHHNDGTFRTLIRPKKRLPSSRSSFIRAVGQAIENA